MKSIANEFCSWPSAPFFLQHTVMMNYGGKVYSVLRGIEASVETNNDYERVLLLTYAVFMVLGMYWYTRFWLNSNDLKQYYEISSSSSHYLTKSFLGSIGVTIGAALYYLIFTVLFTWSYSVTNLPTSLALAVWNFWCSANLVLATPCWRET